MGFMSWFRGRGGDSAVPPSRRAPRRIPGRRNFAAAMLDRLTADFSASTFSLESELAQVQTLRNRARNLARNNDHARRYLQLVRDNVVGHTGIRCQSRAVDANGKPDVTGNKIIESGLADWSRSPCTDGRTSMLALQWLVAVSFARDGEVFIVRRRGRQYRHGIALQVLDPEQIDANLVSVNLSASSQIMGGVEVDSRTWEPVAYHVRDFVTGKVTPIPADDVIHLYEVERPGQTRGITRMATAMLRMQHAGKYEEAELVAARTAAAKMGFFLPSDGAEYTPDDEEDGDPVTEATPGTFEVLPQGMQFQQYDPQHPTTAFPEFMNSVKLGMASGLGVAHSSLTSDYSQANYSSIRQALIEGRDTWKVLQAMLVDGFCQPVFEWWLESAMIGAHISLPYAKFEKFSSPGWQPRGWQWIDPLKDAQATITSVKNGLSTLTDALAERGLDVEDVLKTISSEKQLAEKYGLSLEVFSDGKA